MSTASSDQGFVHAAPTAPDLEWSIAGRPIGKPRSGFAAREATGVFGFARRQLTRLAGRHEAGDRAARADILSEERRRIAADVHDLIMQDLSFALATARALANDPAAPPQATVVVAAGERALAGARNGVQGLVQPRDGDPIVRAVQAGVRAAARNSPVAFDAERVRDSAKVDRTTRDVLVHIAREAVTNALKHAGPGAVVEVVFEHGGEWRLTVRDDGCGFDPTSTSAGFGLESMRARTLELGGSLHVVSAAGAGTTVQATLRDQA
jgi:signal transduction histidine kinase